MKHRLEKSPPPSLDQSATTVERTEKLLEEWFGRPVVLTSSGRSATALVLESYGLSRYRDFLSMPRYMSQCVMDTVTRYAFPLDSAKGEKAATTLFYHQYGFPQAVSPSGPVVEDIAHAFFASAETGARMWAGDAAIFSLPKFFSVSAMVGGVIAKDESLAIELRSRRDAAPAKKSGDAQFEGKVFRARYQTGGPGLEQMFLARLLNPRLLDEELGGVPLSLKEIKDIGAKRRVVLDTLLGAASTNMMPSDWNDMLQKSLPYAFPIAGTTEHLKEIDVSLRSAGVSSDIYNIDVSRNQFSPNYQKMLLVPYSHLVSDDLLEEMVCILRTK